MTEEPFVRYTLRLSAPPADESLEIYDLLGRLQPDGWEEADEGRTIRLWLREGAERDGQTARDLRRLAALGALSNEAQEAGWQDGWRRFHRPVVEGRVRVRPPWYPPDPAYLDVVVDTGMAFGTGSHFTTRLCLRALQQLAPGSLLDAGAGSGVLALAAARLGFGPVIAVDNDPVAVASCARNAAANGIDLTVAEGDVTDEAYTLPAVDACVANLLQGPVLALARRLREGPWRPRDLVVSGLLVEQGDEVVDALVGYELIVREQAAGWLALRLSRTS